MDKLTSILVVASRTDGDRQLLDKAVLLARGAGAQIHLLSCDATLAKILHRAYNTEDAEKAWHISQAEHLAYLRALRLQARAADVRIGIEAECRSPLHECIVNKVHELKSDLVMKAPSGVHPLHRFGFGPSDWHLLRECPVTLMLVGRHPWQSPPSFAALVDLSQENTTHLARMICHTAEHFSLSFGAQLDVIYSESGPQANERSQHEAALSRLIGEYHIPAPHAHIVHGDPETALPDFAARNRYDVVILGGLTHRGGLAPLVGGLTGKLVETLDSDFLLVKPDVAVSSADADSHERHTSSANVVWPALFGD